MFLLFAQLLLPIALLAWLLAKPPTSRVEYVLLLVAILLLVTALRLTGLWTVMPWWLPHLYAAAGMAGAVLAIRRGPRPPLPDRTGWKSALVLLAVCALGGWFVLQGIDGRRLPATPSVALRWPLAPGRHIVANGGANIAVSSHAETLDIRVPRHRPWWGQSYGVDLVELNRFGRTTAGMRPRDPSAYVIFGRPVLAPCSGRAIAALDGRPDMPVPQMDLTSRPGNHVVLRCGSIDVLLAHLQRGSLQVTQGQAVGSGDVVGRVGNSGATGEPHLHIHVQSPGTAEAPFSGRPIPLTFDGQFPIRNDRF